MTHFSPELVTWIKEYYKKRCDIELTDDQAQLYLHDLAGLYEAMEGLVQGKIDNDKAEVQDKEM